MQSKDVHAIKGQLQAKTMSGVWHNVGSVTID